MELVNKKKRAEYKTATYVRYTKLVSECVANGYYSTHKEMLFTFLALSMAAEISRKTLTDSGIKEGYLDDAKGAMLSEVLFLRQLEKTGKAKEMLESHAAEEKKKKAKCRKKI
jgi:hypothetical protein